MSLRLHKEETSFLMIDVQERLLPSIHRREEVVQNAVRLMKVAEVLSLPVLYTEQYPKGIGSTEASVLAALPQGTRRFEKMTFSCCEEPDFLGIFEATMRPVTVVFGTETHICVLSTTEDLLDRGRKIVIAADACGSRTPDNYSLALATLRSCGALVLPTETVVYQLLGRSGTPEFKAMLPLFK
ncbi:MAG: isochorismatase family protein [Synergistaceae bacterium]|jgi:nicotinamidase-related amidase|nr:isochorismatase family protein [Synergistaceae bacterium]